MKQITEFFLEGESSTLIVSHTKVSKLYFYKCVHIILFLSLSTCFTHQFHSYTKILTLILVIPTLNSPHSHPYSSRSHPDSPHSHPYSTHSHPDSHHSHPDSRHSHPDSRHSHHSPHSFPDSQFRLLQIVPFFMISKSLFNQNKFVFNKIYFHYITFFFHDIKIYFYSIKINFYSVRNIFIVHIFFIQVEYIFII